MQDLTDDIRAHGLIDPIVLFEGMILDGRSRAAACERASVAPRYLQFGGGREDAVILVVSHNLKRRHLTKQAIADALVAAEDFNLNYACERAAQGGDMEGGDAEARGGAAEAVIKITEPKTASSRKLAAAAGGLVSHVMIAATRKVKEKGEPALQEAVKRGRIGVQDAARAADLPPERQKAIAAAPKPRRAAAEAAEAALTAALQRRGRGGQRDGPACGAAPGVAEREGAPPPLGDGGRPDEGMVRGRSLVRTRRRRRGEPAEGRSPESPRRSSGRVRRGRGGESLGE